MAHFTQRVMPATYPQSYESSGTTFVRSVVAYIDAAIREGMLPDYWLGGQFPLSESILESGHAKSDLGRVADGGRSHSHTGDPAAAPDRDARAGLIRQASPRSAATASSASERLRQPPRT